MKKLIFVLMMLVLISGCDKAWVMQNTQPTAQPTGQADTVAPEGEAVEPSEVDFSKCKTVVGEYCFDINKDGNEDGIRLAVSAEKENGEIMWDDLHDWLLTVSIGDEDYVLYDGRVALGSVYYNVFERTNGEIVISVTEESTAKYSVTEFVYTGKGFQRSEAVKEEGINFMTSSAGMY